jgi:formimidoylglutamate deiminase
LLFAGGEAAIRDVAVAGRWVIKDRRHAVEDELRPRFTALMQRLARADDLPRAERPAASE